MWSFIVIKSSLCLLNNRTSNTREDNLMAFYLRAATVQRKTLYIQISFSTQTVWMHYHLLVWVSGILRISIFKVTFPNPNKFIVGIFCETFFIIITSFNLFSGYCGKMTVVAPQTEEAKPWTSTYRRESTLSSGLPAQQVSFNQDDIMEWIEFSRYCLWPPVTYHRSWCAGWTRSSPSHAPWTSIGVVYMHMLSVIYLLKPSDAYASVN